MKICRREQLSSLVERMRKALLSCLLIFPDSFFRIPRCSAAVKFVASAVRITRALLELRFLTIHQASGDAQKDPSTPKPPPNSQLGESLPPDRLDETEVAANFQGCLWFLGELADDGFAAEVERRLRQDKANKAVLRARSWSVQPEMIRAAGMQPVLGPDVRARCGKGVFALRWRLWKREQK